MTSAAVSGRATSNGGSCRGDQDPVVPTAHFGVSNEPLHPTNFGYMMTQLLTDCGLKNQRSQIENQSGAMSALSHDIGGAEVRALLVSAFEQLRLQDGPLLERDSSERSLTHRVAMYLAPMFDEYDVDCEYNRHGGDIPKRILAHRERYEDQGGEPGMKSVLPDIVVHHRGDDDRNLVVIEVKKERETAASSSSRQAEAWDRQKLQEYKDQLHYRHGFFIIQPTGPGAGTKLARIEEVPQPNIKPNGST